MSQTLIKQIEGALFADSDPVPEGGSRGWQIDFTDTDGTSVTPNAGTTKWTLSDASGTTINDRADQTVSPESGSAIISIDGPDCAIQDGESDDLVDRVLLVVFEYDSKQLGDGCHGRIEIHFQIRNLVAIK